MRREWGARWARVDGIVRGATVEDEDDSGVGTGRGEDAQGNHTLSGFVASLCCYAFEFRFSGEASLCVVR